MNTINRSTSLLFSLFIILLFALISLTIREGIGGLNTFTKISVKNSDQLVFMKYYKTVKNQGGEIDIIK